MIVFGYSRSAACHMKHFCGQSMATKAGREYLRVASLGQRAFSYGRGIVLAGLGDVCECVCKAIVMSPTKKRKLNGCGIKFLFSGREGICKIMGTGIWRESNTRF